MWTAIIFWVGVNLLFTAWRMWTSPPVRSAAIIPIETHPRWGR